jgi:hypothetical protein
MTNPLPIPAVTERPCQPPPTALSTLPGFLSDAIEDVRVHHRELTRNEASEMSTGKGMVVPWVARQAARERRYPQPDDGYNTPYRGTSPPCVGPPPKIAHHSPHGNRQLVRFLHQYG